MLLRSASFIDEVCFSHASIRPRFWGWWFCGSGCNLPAQPVGDRRCVWRIIRLSWLNQALLQKHDTQAEVCWRHTGYVNVKDRIGTCWIHVISLDQLSNINLLVAPSAGKKTFVRGLVTYEVNCKTALKRNVWGQRRSWNLWLNDSKTVWITLVSSDNSLGSIPYIPEAIMPLTGQVQFIMLWIPRYQVFPVRQVSLNA